MLFSSLLPRCPAFPHLRRVQRYWKIFPNYLSTQANIKPPEQPLSYTTSREAVKRKTEEMQLKYADKLRKKMEQEGVSDLTVLMAKVQRTTSNGPTSRHETAFQPTSPEAAPNRPSPSQSKMERVDGSPLKALNEILNVDKILEREHSADAIHQLWTAYHTTKGDHGFLSASIPTPTYVRMTEIAEKYPIFVLPLPRNVDTGGSQAWEFYLLQWAFFQRPPEPKHSDHLFAPSMSDDSRNSRCSTVLFTPLQEYKLQQSFARPYLVLSHYTDLSHSHNLVLLRGEITPSENNPVAKLLPKQDAHMLAMGMQQFYLQSWLSDDADSLRRRRLLTDFHENQSNFEWQTLIDTAWKT